MKKKIFSILFALILILLLKNTCYAANAGITCNDSATVGEKINITVTGSAVQWNLELKVNGETIAKSSEVDNVDGNKTINFSGQYTPTSEGTLNVTLTGTATEASDGSTIRSFESKTINVKKVEEPDNSSSSDNSSNNTTTTKSSEARLKNLGINPNDFSGFKKDTYTYDVKVPNDVTKVNVYAYAVDSNAKISGTGNVTLKEGENTVKVTVTAEDGTTQKTYTLNITRESAGETTDDETEQKSSEARLSNLGITPKDYDFSGFKKDTTSYSIEVPNEVDEVEVYAEAVSSKATITGTGKVSLNEGENTITVEVTAEDGTTKTYTIEITRKVSETVDDETEVTDDENKKVGLTTLVIKNFDMSPKFDSEIYEYTLGLTEDLTSLEIEAKTSDKNTTVEIIGNENLQLGENVITILVTNVQTDEVTTYQIIVNKSVLQDEVIGINWLKPSTWGKREKIIAGIVIVLIMMIAVAIVLKIRIAREDDEEDLDLPGGDELDRALAEHQELTEDTEIQEEEEKTDAEKAQEYFEAYSKRKGKHF